METTELRIGNLIYNDYVKCNGEITGLFDQEVWIQYPNEAINSRGTISACHPIPLTEEWLLKFGFIYSDILIAKNGISLTNTLNGKYLLPLHNSVGEIAKVIIIEYVHQLQNLYFALTGQELVTNKEDK